MKLHILSSPTTVGLMEEAENYNISQIGSLTVSNGHYFITFIGEQKLNLQPKVTKVTKKATSSA